MIPINSFVEITHPSFNQRGILTGFGEGIPAKCRKKYLYIDVLSKGITYKFWYKHTEQPPIKETDAAYISFWDRLKIL